MNRSEQSQEGTALRRTGKVLLVVALTSVLLLTGGCAKLRARDQLNKGVQAYKTGKFEEAVEHFKNATQYDPSLLVARLYLATAYVAQYVPGSDDANNKRMADGAIEQYQKVLESGPSQSTQILSLKGLASLYLNMKDFDKAKEYYNKAIQVDPNDPENYYSVAVIDWTQSYVPRMEKRRGLGLKLDEPLKDKKVCQELKDANSSKVEEGIQMLNKALDLRKDYDDAMAYMNLLYRERADIQCGDDEARKADLATADEWVAKTMATKKAKLEKQNEQKGGIVLDQQKK